MIVIWWDPGHGGYDPGAIGCGVQEKDYTLKMTLHAGKYLEQKYEGVRSRYTRTTDVFVPLRTRSIMANEAKADAFISLHNNSAGPTATGWETYTSVPAGAETQRLRGHIDDAVMSVLAPLGIRNRGRKRVNHTVTYNTRMPAVLTESLFLSNCSDVAVLKKHWKAIAEAHAIGVARHFKLKLKKGESAKVTNHDKTKYTPPESMRVDTATVLKRLEEKEREPLSIEHRRKLNRGELSVDEAIGLLYVAVRRGHIKGY